MDKYIGRLLDNRYEILEIIGTGGMAVVYKARCHRLNRLVAIKILKDDYLQDEEFRRRFHSESQAVAMLSHPNIVSVYDVSSSIMADYIVMELIDGITLKQYMEKKGILNWKETLHFGIQIAKALEHAHSRGIVHRDIKPHNVMVLKNGSVKVMDFGIARMMSKGNTLTKEALGSVHYISPEQAKGGRVDSRSDIYSLGVVMYEMMAGRPPYDGDSPVSVAIQHINGGAVMPSTLNPNIPGGMEQIIMKAMAHEIGDRYVSTTRMLSDMDEFRKNPSLLFDYNAPADDVMKMPPTMVLPNLKDKEGQLPEEKPSLEPIPFQKLETRSRNRATDAERAAKPKTPATQEKRREQKQRQAAESSSRAATIAIIVCAIVAVVAIGILLYFFFTTPKEEYVTVPNLLGVEYTDGMTIDGFTIKVDKENHEEVPEGQIYEQKPKAGDKVVKGTTLFITVSLGKTQEETGEIIDFTNEDLEWTQEQLKNMKLELKVLPAEEHHADIKEGKVTRTDPPAGSTVTKGQTVTVYVSKGPGDGEMPDVLKFNKEKAIKELNDMNLKLVIDDTNEVFDSELPAGFVVRTEPAAGTQIVSGQTIKLYISKGPELAAVPNVIGMSYAQAQQELAKVGIKNVSCDGNTDGNVVIAQSVDADKEMDVSKTITLTIGVKKSVTFSWTNENAELGCRLKITRDGKVLVDVDLAAGVAEYVLEGQIGNGPVTYLVSINGTEPWEETVNF